MKREMRSAYGELLQEIGENENIYVLDADLASSTRTNKFQEKFPDRFLNMGIAEADMIGTAAGLAIEGKIVFASSFCVFLAGRAYDQVRQSIAYNDLNVKLVATHSGLTPGKDGATHQLTEDIALMRTMPNMRVLVPSDYVSTKKIISETLKDEKPVYVRLSKESVYDIYNEDEDFSNVKSKEITNGKDATIFACGNMVQRALMAKQKLDVKGIQISVVDMFSIKPVDSEMILKKAKETKVLISLEDHNILGGLGSCISEVLTSSYPTKLIRLGVNDTFRKIWRNRRLN